MTPALKAGSTDRVWDLVGIGIIEPLAMMSDAAWLILVLLSLAAFFIIAGFTVKTFRYKYGGSKFLVLWAESSSSVLE